MERQKLPLEIGKIAAEGKALVAKLDEVEGPGRRLVEESLEEKGTCLSTMEGRLFTVERALRRIGEAEVEARWIAETITRFDDVWDHLTATNRGRLVRALIQEVVVNEPNNTVTAALTDIGLPELPDLPDASPHSGDTTPAPPHAEVNP